MFRGDGVVLVIVGRRIETLPLASTIHVPKITPLPSVIVTMPPLSPPVHVTGVDAGTNGTGTVNTGGIGAVWSVTFTVLVAIFPVLPAVSVYV
jgi:hypothetical protein